MENNAHYMLPSRDACYVDPGEMPKFLRSKNMPNRHGVKRMMQEGFMIRQSYIESGKIVIPAGGLIYFENGGEYFGPLNSEPVSIAGEEAVWIEQEEAMVVKKDFFVPFDDRPVPLGEDGTISLQPFFYTDSYFGEKAGFLRFVFANGHPGWEKRIVLCESEYGKYVANISTGYVDEEGMQTPPPIQYFGNPFDAHNSTYIVVENLGPKGFQVKEAGAPEVNWFKISYTPPIVVDCVGEGETVKAGEYRIKVISCHQESGIVTVAVLNTSGEILSQKELGPLTLETYKKKNFIHQNMAVRNSLVLDYENIRVQLDTKYNSILGGIGPTPLIDENGENISVTDAKGISTFQENGVGLVIYTDIEKVPLRRPWKKDSRFVFQTHYT